MTDWFIAGVLRVKRPGWRRAFAVIDKDGLTAVITFGDERGRTRYRAQVKNLDRYNDWEQA